MAEKSAKKATKEGRLESKKSKQMEEQEYIYEGLLLYGRGISGLINCRQKILIFCEIISKKKKLNCVYLEMSFFDTADR